MTSDEPLAYQIGDQPFLGLTIYLDSHPLIPRPETEWWTEKIIAGAKNVSEERVSQRDSARGGDFSAEKDAALSEEISLRFLDLCAGSGAIGCAALKYLPGAEVYFGEIDPAHESTILKNIRENHLDESRAHVSIGDLFAPFVGMTFDLIAANPPYIPSDRVLDSSVTDYEPALALRSGTDGLDLIRRIALELGSHLAPRGEAWVECDIENIAEAKKLFEARGFSAEIHTDQYKMPRFLVVSWVNGRSSAESARAA